MYTTTQSKATTIINNLMNEKGINLHMGTIVANNNLIIPQLTLLYHLKYRKNPKSASLKTVLVKAWNKTKNIAPINVP